MLGRVLFTSLCVAASVSMCLITDTAEARKLNDLIKRPPQLYLPSQLTPGKTAVFTLKGKPGQQARLILSSNQNGLTLPDGTTLRVGPPLLEATGTIPESGVLEMKVKTPKDKWVPGEKQFVEAVVWTEPSQGYNLAQIIESSGAVTTNNIVLVGEEASPGSMMLIPGDMGMSGIMRSLDTMNNVKDDPRKKQLIDDGAIDRKRLLDRQLPSAPSQ